MLRRSRVGSTPDLTRISVGVQRAGIDPRINTSLAYTLKESTIDKEHGHFVDVKLLPSELELTCRVPQEYAGKSYGNHEGVIHANEEVYVALPDGDPAFGAFVIARVWSKSHPPPQEVVDHPKDIVRVIEKDSAFRAVLKGAKGLIDLVMEASVSVKMANGVMLTFDKDGMKIGVSPTDWMALATKVHDEVKALRDAVASLRSAYNSHSHDGSTLVAAFPSGAVSGSTGPTSDSAAAIPATGAVSAFASEFVKSK